MVSAASFGCGAGAPGRSGAAGVDRSDADRAGGRIVASCGGAHVWVARRSDPGSDGGADSDVVLA
ncbi:hypothetical protein, partial [Jatrophihabitans endophyticus]|uniref:hypothetical protein n=1 Tax=Jatrophihabitans endophyticus TaxID=1206085 RepID=UPI0026E92DCF